MVRRRTRLLNLALLLAFCLPVRAGLEEESRYQASPHRLEAAIRDHDIASYSINLLWVNQTLDFGNKYISGADTQRQLKAELFDPVMRWAVSNPSAKVNLWYDSAFCAQEAIETTKDLFHYWSGNRFANIEMRDVRDIPIVGNNPDAFSEQVPIYFRIDLLKAIIIVHSIENEQFQSALFSDLEVGDLRMDRTRLGKSELFNAAIMPELLESGLVLNKSYYRNENQFLQLYNNSRMISAIKHAVINTNLWRAVTALNSKQMDFIAELGMIAYPSIQQHVFDYCLGTLPGVQIKVRPDIVQKGRATDPWLDYDPKQHGYAPFGLRHCSQTDRFFIIDHEGNRVWQEDMLKFPFPTVGPMGAPARDVEVRAGNYHVTDPEDLVAGKPNSDDGVYKCEFWD
jgi:hypothetical protein